MTTKSVKTLIYTVVAVATVAFPCLLPLYLTGTKDNSPSLYVVLIGLLAVFAAVWILTLVSEKICYPKRNRSLSGQQNGAMIFPFFFTLAVVYFLTSSFYADITVTQNRGIELYCSLFSGNGFRQYIYESVFYIPLHIITGLWSIPFVILQLNGINVLFNTVAILWIKLLFVIAAIGCVWQYSKLLDLLETEDKEFWIFALCASPLFFMPVFAWAFYDQIELFFGLCAIVIASNEEKLSWKTLLLLSVSVAIKALFLFPAVLLILVKEKRILYVVRDGLIVLMIPAVLFLLFHVGGLGIPDPALESILPVILLPKVFPGIIDMPLFFLIFFMLCFLAFFCVQSCCGKVFILNISWLISACYLALLLLTNHAHPQWSILLVPFLLLLTAGGHKTAREKLILSFVCQFFLIFSQFYVFAEGICLNDYNFQGLLLKSWEARTYRGLNISSFGNLIDYLGLAEYMGIFPAVSLAAAVFLLFRNFTWKPMSTDLQECQKWRRGKRGIMILLLVFLYGCFIFTFLIAAII